MIRSKNIIIFLNRMVPGGGLYLLIGDFFQDLTTNQGLQIRWSCLVQVLIVIWILILSRNIYVPRARICKKFITNVPHVHNIAPQTRGKIYFETFQSLRLTNIVIVIMIVCLIDIL